MKRLLSFALIILLPVLLQQCQQNPVDSTDSQIPSEKPNLLSVQSFDKTVPAAMDTVNGTDENTRQGGAYVAIVRDIIFTNPFIGIPLVTTLSAPVQHPEPGVWIWEKQILQAKHHLEAQWDGVDGYDWSYVWNGGIFQNFPALDGHTDVPGLNGNYTMYYHDAGHSVYGTKTWSVDSDTTLTIGWIRAKYDPLNVPKRRFLAHFRVDGSGDLTFWKNDVKRFYIEWQSNGTGFWQLWPETGGYLTNKF